MSFADWQRKSWPMKHLRLNYGWRARSINARSRRAATRWHEDAREIAVSAKKMHFADMETEASNDGHSLGVLRAAAGVSPGGNLGRPQARYAQSWVTGSGNKPGIRRSRDDTYQGDRGQEFGKSCQEAATQYRLNGLIGPERGTVLVCSERI
jgi:hypothetical protein